MSPLDLLATASVGLVVLVLAVAATVFMARRNRAYVKELAVTLRQHAELYASAARLAGAGGVIVSDSELTANVTGTYAGYRFSISTTGTSDDNPLATMITMSGRNPERWPRSVVPTRSSRAALPPDLRLRWDDLQKVGQLVQQGMALKPGTLMLAPRSEEWPGQVPKQPATYQRCLEALAALVRELDSGRFSR